MSRPAALRETLVSADPQTRKVLALASRLAGSSSSVLILGEAGTGKSLLARQIHSAGPRASSPFVEIPCANLPAELIESELFGHEKGAFTGAVSQRIGRFEAADGGTVLIDGVCDLPPPLQAKLLRVLQEKSFERLGGARTIEVDVRVLASAHPRIEDMVETGGFRADLFYRINVVTLRLPPLRNRPKDIPLLAARFLKEAGRRFGTTARLFSAEALEVMTRHEWPGNVRELRNVCECAALRAAGREVSIADLPLDSMRTVPGLVARAASRGMSLEEVEAAYIREVLHRLNGNRSAAARVLKISRKTLLEKLRRHGAGSCEDANVTSDPR